MKLTTKQIKKLIKEELNKLLKESRESGFDSNEEIPDAAPEGFEKTYDNTSIKSSNCDDWILLNLLEKTAQLSYKWPKSWHRPLYINTFHAKALRPIWDTIIRREEEIRGCEWYEIVVKAKGHFPTHIWEQFKDDFGFFKKYAFEFGSPRNNTRGFYYDLSTGLRAYHAQAVKDGRLPNEAERDAQYEREKGDVE